jgi:hypothetical protein
MMNDIGWKLIAVRVTTTLISTHHRVKPLSMKIKRSDIMPLEPGSLYTCPEQGSVETLNNWMSMNKKKSHLRLTS